MLFTVFSLVFQNVCYMNFSRQNFRQNKTGQSVVGNHCSTSLYVHLWQAGGADEGSLEAGLMNEGDVG